MNEASSQSVKKNWHPLEHLLWRELRRLPKVKGVVVALSGGADSVALLLALKTIASAAQLHVAAQYVHHGDSLDPKQLAFRDKSESFCQQLCAQLEISFLNSVRPKRVLKNEDEWRDFRYQQLRQGLERLALASGNDLARQTPALVILATGHHREDLLETRLMRLLRGTGPEGLPAMQTYQNKIWRPWLSVSKKTLLEYLQANKQNFIEDPSNYDTDYLRNWLRQDCLPSLEKQAPGSVESLARSLELIAETLVSRQNMGEGIIEQGKDREEKEIFFIKRADFLALPLHEQKLCLVQLLKKANIRKYSQGQINEILKQLDNPQKVHRFSLADSAWIVDAEQISLSRK